MTNGDPNIYCTHPGCEKIAAERVNGSIKWHCRHSGETHVNFMSVEELARWLGEQGYVLLTVAELVELLTGKLDLAGLQRRYAA